MERGWFETIQVLGLDVMGSIALAMLVLDGLIEAVALVAKAITRRAAPGRVETRTHAAAQASDAWPPKEWRPSH